MLGPQQGEAADRPGDRRDEQLQVAAARPTTPTRRPRPGSTSRRPTSWSTGRTSTRPSSCSPTFSIRTRASRCCSQANDGAGDAGLSARGASRVQCGGDRRSRGRLDATTTLAANPLAQLPGARQPAGVSPDRRRRARPPPTPRSGGSSATSRRRSPTWRTGRSRSRSRAAGSEADFNQDIVVRFKASERGAAAVLNPRYVVKSTG